MKSFRSFHLRGVLLGALATGLLVLPHAAHAAEDRKILTYINRLNQISEEQISDKTDPAYSLLRSIYDEDGPDFSSLRRLLGKAEVRSRLNPSVRCVFAGVISQRWDAFELSGSLYLSGLKSRNPDLRDKARRKMAAFIQTKHVPELIELLNVPGPNVLAYEILKEATGQPISPSVPAWRKWWKLYGGKVDVTGHLLKVTRARLKQTRIHPFDQERFWYLPEGIKDAQMPFARRPERDQDAISSWNNWAMRDVRRFVDDWTDVKEVLDRVVHHPDPRVNKYLETLVTDPGYGDYASVLLAWRSSRNSLPILQMASRSQPTVGRILAIGTLGDRTSLEKLLQVMERHQTQPLSYKIMDDQTRNYLPALRTVGIFPAEQAFELLCHRNFDFTSAYTMKEKKAAFKEAKSWLRANASKMTFDRRRGYFAIPD